MKPLSTLPRSTPEEQGIRSEAIMEFLDEVNRKEYGMHSIMVLRHGHVVAEGWWAPYRHDDKHMLFSLSKSFTSTAIGFARAEKLLTLEDPVISYFPEDLPEEVTPNLAAMRIEDLLVMGTGQATEPPFRHAGDGNWARAFLAAPVEYMPGTRFSYNSGATYMLAAILHKVTGQFLLDYLQSRLLEPLGITGAIWEKCPRGIAAGGWGLSITTEDIAKFGQLYLKMGIWNGKRILPEGWVEEATSKQITNGEDPENDWHQGYGYQFWRCRHGAFRGDGAFGQFCIVLPGKELVIAITSGSGFMGGIMNSLWKHLLPALGPAPLPSAPELQAALLSKLKGLHYTAPALTGKSREEARLNGQFFAMEPNHYGFGRIGFRFDHREAILSVGEEGQVQLRLGREEWCVSKVRLHPLEGPQRVAASFTWKDDGALQLTIRLLEAPFVLTVTIRQEDAGLELEVHLNVSFGNFQVDPIRGRRIPAVL